MIKAISHEDIQFFPDWEAMTTSENYNNFRIIQVNNMSTLTDWPATFPCNLQGLRIERCTSLRKFPQNLPSTVEFIKINDTKICEIPQNSIAHLNMLEELNLYMNGIEKFDLILPQNIISLHLNYNCIVEFSSELPDALKYINLSYNQLKHVPNAIMQKINALTLVIDHNDFDKYQQIKAPPSEINAVITEREREKRARVEPINDFVNFRVRNPENNNLNNAFAQMFQERFNENPPPPNNYNAVPRMFYKHHISDDVQNVHDHEIQETAESSCANIIAYRPEINFNPAYLNEILTELRNQIKSTARKKSGANIFKKMLFSLRTDFSHPLEYYITKWSEENILHAKYGVTFNQLLERVWLILKDLREKHNEEYFINVFSILIDELMASRGVCATGVMTRIINSLVGIYEGVEIRISDKQELTNRAAAILTRNTQLYGEDSEEFKINYKKEMENLLASYELSNYEKLEWENIINELI